MTACTIMTIWNNEPMFRELVEELAQQKDIAVKFLDIDNRQCRFDGPRSAFNAYLDQVETEYVLFVHQDIRFLHEHALYDILQRVKELDGFGVAGVAGCPGGSERRLLSNIVHGADKKPAGKRIFQAEEVQSLDECLFIMRTETLRKLPFTSVKGWHLYAVEQCLRAEATGLKNYVIPADVYHLSDGNSLDPCYIAMLLDMGHKYKIKELNTTVKRWEFNSLKGRCYIRYYYWKQQCKKLLRQLRLLKG